MTDSTSQITMSDITSTSTEPAEEAITSFVHSVRKYELKDQVYPLVGHMDYVHEFTASTTALQQFTQSKARDSLSKSHLMAFFTDLCIMAKSHALGLFFECSSMIPIRR